ncbi:MAG: hypothetical protein RMK21_02495 [Aquificaceae bacterium]|nr:hypothetical protein [Aquificaceae bacterium]
MVEYVSRRGSEARLYFSSVEERNLFLRGMSGMEGVEGVEYKENTRTLLIKFREGSFAHYLLENIASKRGPQKLEREDINFYLQPFLKHPAVKLGFSMLLLGWGAGLISFAVCSIFLTPYLKNKL